MGNAPMYAMMPEHNTQSPSTVVFYYYHSTTFLPQAIFSPPRPLINWDALSSCNSQSLTFLFSSSYLSLAFLYSSSSFFNNSSTSAKAAFFSASYFSAFFNFYSASASCFFLGSTTSRAPYVSTTARIHSDNEPAALEALNTFFYSKSGCTINCLSLFTFALGIALILSSLNSLTLVISLAFKRFFLE